MDGFLVAVVAVLIIGAAYALFLFLRNERGGRRDAKTPVGPRLEEPGPRPEASPRLDPGKIYQGGLVVGEVLGDVRMDGHHVWFRHLADTTCLVPDQPIEYRQSRLRILSVGERTGMVTNTTDMGTIIYRDVLGKVLCELLK